MADSLFGSLLNMLDSRDLRGISNVLGEPEHSVSRSMQNSIAAVMGTLLSRAGDPGALRRAIDLLPASVRDAMGSDLVQAATDPNSPAIGIGQRIVSGLFGSSEGEVINAIGKHNGIKNETISKLLAVCAGFVLSFIGRKVRDDGLSMNALGNMLQRESGAIRNALPAELTGLLMPRPATMAAGASPVVAQEVVRGRSTNWAAPLALGLMALGLAWWFGHRRPIVVERTRSAPIGTASRAREEPTTSVPTPESSRSTVSEPVNKTAATMVVLRCDPGSSTLTPQSQARLNRLVAQAAANPNMRLNVAGYTDNSGNEDANLKLSQQRADNVMAILVKKGIAPGRVASKGYGEADPVATNDTAQGRAANRRVIISVE